MTTKLYHSAMLGAPVLSGTAGALREALKSCAVTGFGLRTAASLVVAGGVATLTLSTDVANAQLVNTVVLVDGVAAPMAALNGEQRVTAGSSTTLQFATTVADGTATGTITVKTASAGWQSLFDGTLTNVLALKPSVPETTGCVLRIDDTGTINARVRAYESMSDISSGVGVTPLESQCSGGLWWPKSGTANATARPWFMVADARGVYLAVAPQGTDRYTLIYAGDVASLKSGDAYGFAITGNQADQTAATAAPDGCCGYSHRSARTGAYLVRAHTAIGQAIAAQRIGSHHNGATADVYAGSAGYSYGTYPNGPNNGLLTGALELFGAGIRGTLPGLLHPVQDCGNAFASGAVVDGTDDMAGRKLLALRVAPPSGSSTPGTVFLDITGPWER